MRMSLKSLAGNEPVPSGTYTLGLAKIDEKVFDKGSWGFKARFKILEGEYEGKAIFENLVILDPEGEVSGAVFRFAQFATVTVGEELEVDLQNKDEVKDVLTAAIDVPFQGKVVVEPDDKGNPRNRIEAYNKL
jgi:hypothetical protein